METYVIGYKNKDNKSDFTIIKTNNIFFELRKLIFLNYKLPNFLNNDITSFIEDLVVPNNDYYKYRHISVLQLLLNQYSEYFKKCNTKKFIVMLTNMINIEEEVIKNNNKDNLKKYYDNLEIMKPYLKEILTIIVNNNNILDFLLIYNILEVKIYYYLDGKNLINIWKSNGIDLLKLEVFYFRNY